MAAGSTVRIEGKEVELTHLDKVFYPDTGFTKAQVIDYYRRMAPYILPHLEGRPITLKRYPEGVAGEFFYEKTCPAHRPTWVTTSAGRGGIDIDFCLIDGLPALVWAANLASIEMHALLAQVDDLSRPTVVAFDLDPGPPATLRDCLDLALIMRDMLAGLGLKSFPKTSGGKGLHFFVPLNTEVTYDQTKPFARAVAETMEKHYPDRVVSKMAKSLRPGKVLIDWSQNTEHKTMACVYSLRARSQPTVSLPLRWEEIEHAARVKDASRLIYTAERAVARVEKEGDLFREVLTLRQRLSAGVPTSKPTGALRTYRKKRDFTATPEPTGIKSKSHGGPVFVIQKHAAKRLHYDLRLEVEGVLKSWSVPRGPSSDPAERRLAVQVEDHPLDYQDFEGVIPKGQYGAGQVILWDRGVYRNLTGDPNHPTPMSQALAEGKVEVFFEGEKIKGGYVLIQMQGARMDKSNWLLSKLKDEYVGSLSDDLEGQGASVLTGRTIQDLRRS